MTLSAGNDHGIEGWPRLVTMEWKAGQPVSPWILEVI